MTWGGPYCARYQAGYQSEYDLVGTKRINKGPCGTKYGANMANIGACDGTRQVR
jgi:hypothetical protein